jgi:hypothetical protein
MSRVAQRVGVPPDPPIPNGPTGQRYLTMTDLGPLWKIAGPQA